MWYTVLRTERRIFICNSVHITTFSGTAQLHRGDRLGYTYAAFDDRLAIHKH